MPPFHEDDRVTVHHGDALDVLPTLPDCSVDSVVTDPPYGLEFMNAAWDSFKPSAARLRTRVDGRTNPREGKSVTTTPEAYVAGHPFQRWCEEWTAECLRVLKPGGHMLAFGGTRTWHRLACAVEDAGFEIRDTITWLYGSGFPKSLDVGKAIDRAAGAEREVIGAYQSPEGTTGWRGQAGRGVYSGADQRVDGEPRPLTAPATEDAARWEGWGTALKPASEPVVVARRPLAGTVAQNVVTWGTGALNIAATRVPGALGGDPNRFAKTDGGSFASFGDRPPVVRSEGRWPSNVVLTHSPTDPEDGCEPSCPVAELDAQSGLLSTHGSRKSGDAREDERGWRFRGGEQTGDKGAASRFFPVFRYQAKAPSRERPSYVREGSSDAWAKAGIRKRCAICGKQEVNVGASACSCPEPDFQPDPSMTGKVAHPTVKPLGLMRWLCRLVNPPGGVVLDPFGGSGATAEAAILEGFRCVTIEREAEYLPLILERIRRQQPVEEPRPAAQQMSLLDEGAA